MQRDRAVGQRGPDLNNHAAIAWHHQFQRGAGSVYEAKIGHVSDAAKFIRRQGTKRCQHRTHRIVNPHINRAEAIFNLVCRVHHRLAVGDIRLYRTGFDAKSR